MLLPFTQWVRLTVAFRIYLAMNFAMINSDLTMDPVVDIGDAVDARHAGANVSPAY